jgi:NAD(P)-dependent dehydrogenase (short-subunit alcohol dehydrogenase family)
MARILAKELLPRRIRVNMVSPGPTDTEIFKRDATPETIAEMKAIMANVVPIGRMGTSEELANAVLFLASARASFINGVDLFVDGGCIELR